MGQRSQIYVKVDGKLAVANYYQWNYGTRMVSRARHGIEYIKNSIEYPFIFFEEKFRRIWDVNFDYQDMVLSSNIMTEWQEYKWGGLFSEFCFDGQDNNDGKLFVDVNTKPELFMKQYSN